MSMSAAALMHCKYWRTKILSSGPTFKGGLRRLHDTVCCQAHPNYCQFLGPGGPLRIDDPAHPHKCSLNMRCLMDAESVAFYYK